MLKVKLKLGTVIACEMWNDFGHGFESWLILAQNERYWIVNVKLVGEFWIEIEDVNMLINCTCLFDWCRVDFALKTSSSCHEGFLGH